MYHPIRPAVLALTVCFLGCRCLLGAERASGSASATPQPQGQEAAKQESAPGHEPASVAWESDYARAMGLADRQKKMLVLYFFDPASPLCKRFEQETLADAKVRRRLADFVCVRLSLDARITQDDREVVLLGHSAFGEMHAQPGIALVDFSPGEPRYHGCVVSTFPLGPRLFYGPGEMLTILDLPHGTLSQRTLIYAVRTHPERPASAAGQPDQRLLDETESHSQCQAQCCRQGHHNWESRFQRISGLMGCGVREVCAESWPGQDLVEAAIECVRSWRCSPGHWGGVSAPNSAFGYDMKRGSNGVWYGTGVFTMR
jgi:hypothetical protein